MGMLSLLKASENSSGDNNVVLGGRFERDLQAVPKYEDRIKLLMR